MSRSQTAAKTHKVTGHVNPVYSITGSPADGNVQYSYYPEAPPPYREVEPRTGAPSQRPAQQQIRVNRTRTNTTQQQSNQKPSTAVGVAASLIIIVLVVFLIGFPFITIFMGGHFYSDCPAQRMIPIFNIITGLVTYFYFAVLGKFSKGKEDDFDKICMKTFSAIVGLFFFAWYITGGVWVYSIYEPDYYHTHKPNYCHKTLYMFTFWVVIFGFVIFSIVIIAGIAYFIRNSGKKSTEEVIVNAP